MYDSKEAVIETPMDIEKVESKAYVHRVHKIEGTDILVHEETEEEINARKFGDADKVTVKTWIVVAVLALSYAISFWPVPNLSYFESVLAPALGDAGNAVWFIEVIEVVNSVSFLICGANSDLFGRRWFIIIGNVFCVAGFLIIGSAINTQMVIAGMALVGWDAGCCQMAAFALPELLPNKWRHIGVVIADAGIFFTVIVGPVTGKYSSTHGPMPLSVAGASWRWIFYGGAVASTISGILVWWLYFPPKHPRGIPWSQAVRELDYVGALLFIAGLVLTLTGIVLTISLPSSDPKVVSLLVVGFATLAAFACWETFAELKQPLTPTRIFTKDKGREFTAPFVAGLIVTMYYFGTNIFWGTAINTLYVTPTSSANYGIILTLPQGLANSLGALLLICFGSKIGHWKWMYVAVVTWMVFWGGLLALATPDNKGQTIAFLFLEIMAYGWAQYLSIAYIQLGVAQHDLGIAGGLAGTARTAGGSVAICVYTTILVKVQSSHALDLVPKAVIAAGGTAKMGTEILAAFPLDAAALEKVPGLTTAIAGAAGLAFQESYRLGLRAIALTTVGFGIVLIAAVLCCNDIGHKDEQQDRSLLGERHAGCQERVSRRAPRKARLSAQATTFSQPQNTLSNPESFIYHL